MKILIVSQYFPPEPSRIGDLVLGLEERGYEVTVLTGKPNYPVGRFTEGYGFLRPLEERYSKTRVVRVPLVPRGSGSSVRMILNYLSYAFFASVLGPLLLRERFDLVFVCQLSPFTVALPGLVFRQIKKAPMLFWIQDLWPESLAASGIDSPLMVKPVDRLVRYTYERCDLILVVSEGFVPSLRSRGADSSRIVHWPQWAETYYRPLEPVTLSKESEELPEGFTIMFAGNIGAAQDFDTIVAAANLLREYRDIHWVILGDGRRRKSVAENVKSLGLEDNFHLLGSRPAQSMPGYFALADALLVTLRRKHIFALTIPGKVQSYMACGKPVLAAADGETAQALHESGAGLAAAAEDAEGLAARALELYRMGPDERAQMGSNARAYFQEHFEREKLLDRLEGWMRDYVGKAN